MRIWSHFMWQHLDCSLSCCLCGSLFPHPMCCLSWSPAFKQKRWLRLVRLEVCSIPSRTRSIGPVGLFSCHLFPPLSVWWEPFTTCLVVACTFSLSPSTVYSLGPFFSLANWGTEVLGLTLRHTAPACTRLQIQDHVVLQHTLLTLLFPFLFHFKQDLMSFVLQAQPCWGF